MKGNKISVLAMTIVCALLSASCSSGKQPAANGADSGGKVAELQPVTLTFYTRTVLDDFELYVNRFVQKKFPHVTLKVVENKQGTRIEELVAAGDIPDIIWEGLTNIGTLVDLKVPADLTPLAQRYGFKFDKYDPKMLDTIKSYAPKSEIYYLPYNVLAFALHYNKDIFDKFGVPYPKENMTWNEAIELGKKLNRSDGGLTYVGLRPPLDINRMQSQLSLAYVDPATEKAVVHTDKWKKLFETFKSTYGTPGQPVVKSFFEARDEFLNKRTVAMLPDILLLQNSEMPKLESDGFRWDFVTYPSFEDKPGIGPGVFSDGFVIPNGSKNQDLAFQIAAYLSTDPEVQMEAGKNGRLTATNDKKLLEQAFDNNPAAKGKNVKSVVSQNYPEPYATSSYHTAARAIVNGRLLDYVNGKSDVNTLLQQAEEQVNKKVGEMKAAK
ncbi:ABC transporter substrate-binding protein [Paenibacillus sp. GCM10012303]|uniref:ABC transporter substrate-binding protein n=1 Tax=Paenibacillus sp. GCM10012303 TaxID=3317340 RepID=UPI003618DDC4